MYTPFYSAKQPLIFVIDSAQPHLSLCVKPPKKRVESDALKINFPHSNFYILAIGTSYGPYKHPHVKG